MTAERKLLSTGMPIEDIVSMCDSLRREGGLEEYVQQQESGDTCKCSKPGSCPGCPHKIR